jgi:hypothetical protein
VSAATVHDATSTEEVMRFEPRNYTTPPPKKRKEFLTTTKKKIIY